MAATSSQGIDSFGAKVAISSTAGGASSAVAGGSFTDGAVTGAYVYLFNHHAHQIETNARIKKEIRKQSGGSMTYQEWTNMWRGFRSDWINKGFIEAYKNLNLIKGSIELTTTSGAGGHDARNGTGKIVEMWESVIDDGDFYGGWKKWVGRIWNVRTSDSTIVIDRLNGNRGMIVPLLDNGNPSYLINYGNKYRTATFEDSLKYLK